MILLVLALLSFWTVISGSLLGDGNLLGPLGAGPSPLDHPLDQLLDNIAESQKAILDNTTTTSLTTTTVILTSTVGTVTITATATSTTLVTTTTTTLEIASDSATTTFTTTLPTPTSRVDTTLTSQTATVTATTATTATTTTTITVGLLTATLTDSISLTEQVYISLPLTFIQHITHLSFTCFNTSPSPTTVTATSTLTTTITDALQTCPTKAIMACPCTLSYAGFVFLNNRDLTCAQSACACERVNAEPADLNDYDVPFAVDAMLGCSGGCATGRTAWVRRWRGVEPEAGQCWALQWDGEVVSVACGLGMSVLCRFPAMDLSNCYSCQFRWAPHCRHCPPYLQANNPYGTCYSGVEECDGDGGHGALLHQHHQHHHQHHRHWRMKREDRLQMADQLTTTIFQESTVSETSTLSVTGTVTGTTSTAIMTSQISTSTLTTTTTTYSSTITTLSSPQPTTVTVTELLVFTETVDDIFTSTLFEYNITIKTSDYFTTIASTTDFAYVATTTTTDTFTVQMCDS